MNSENEPKASKVTSDDLTGIKPREVIRQMCLDSLNYTYDSIKNAFRGGSYVAEFAGRELLRFLYSGSKGSVKEQGVSFYLPTAIRRKSLTERFKNGSAEVGTGVISGIWDSMVIGMISLDSITHGPDTLISRMTSQEMWHDNPLLAAYVAYEMVKIPTNVISGVYETGRCWYLRTEDKMKVKKSIEDLISP